MYRILISDKLAEEGIDILKKEKEFEVDVKTSLQPQQLKEIIGDYDAIVIRSATKLGAEVIEKAKKLKVIGRAGVGLDNVDIEAATRRGIIVMNAPSGNTISAAEHTLALLLSLCRNIPQAHNSLTSRQWERSKFKGLELYGKKLGVIGLGRIGREVIKRALAFGMEILGYDPFISQEAAEKMGVKLKDLTDLLKESDFITIHTPLTKETENMIGEEELKLLKPKVRIVNCARGGIINEEALCKFLTENKKAAAALDVFKQEPPLDSPLLGLDNIIVTPHLGASTTEAQINVAIEIAHCVTDALLGRGMRNAVNFVRLDEQAYRILNPYFNLAEKMGSFLSQIISGGIKEIVLTYKGDITNFKLDVLAMSFIKGVLSPRLEEGINFVNALEIARERGIKINQMKSSQDNKFTNSIEAKVISDKEEKTIEGTLFNKDPRLVKIDNVYIETPLSGKMILVYNADKPGVVGKIGTLIASLGVNIATMSVTRDVPGKNAVIVLNVDGKISERDIQNLLKDKDIFSLKTIDINP